MSIETQITHGQTKDCVYSLGHMALYCLVSDALQNHACMVKITDTGVEVMGDMENQKEED